MNPDTDTVDLRRRLLQLHEHRVLILTCTVLGGVVALAVALASSRVYVAEAALAISRSKIGDTTTTADVLSTADFRPLIESRAVAAQVIKETGLDKAPYWVSPTDFFGEVVEIVEIRNSSVLRLQGRLKDPQLVARVVNRVAELGAETARKLSQQEALQARNDIKIQLDEAARRFDSAASNLEVARTRSQLELSRKDVEAALAQRGAYLELLISIETERARLARAEQELKKRDRIETVTRSIDRDPALMESARAVDGQPRDLLALQMKNEEINPVYQELDRQIAISRTRLAGLERQKAQMVARDLDDPQLARLSEMYIKESEIGRLEVERDLAKKVYQEVANSYESARLLVAGRSSALQILSQAIAPDKPESRKIARDLLIGMLSGFLLSTLAVLVRESVR